MFVQLLFGVPRSFPINNGGRWRFNHDGEHIAESQVELAQIVPTTYASRIATALF